MVSQRQTVNNVFQPAYQGGDGVVLKSSNSDPLYDNSFYLVSRSRTSNDGIQIRQSTGVDPNTGLLMWPGDNEFNGKNLIIPRAPGSTDVDYGQSVVDNSDRIWVNWREKESDGLYHNKWAVIGHDSGFLSVVDQPREWLTPSHWVHRLTCDTYYGDRVYAIAMEPKSGTLANVLVIRMDETQAAPKYTELANLYPGTGIENAYWNSSTLTSYLPGHRFPDLRPSIAANHGKVYAVWYERRDNTYPSMIRMRRLIDNGTSLMNDAFWSFDGTNVGQSGVWNCPYRVDVSVANRNSATAPNTIAITFYGGTIASPYLWSDGSYSAQTTSTTRRMLTNTGDGELGTTWYDTQLSSASWSWDWSSFTSPPPTGAYALSFGHNEWYRGQIDHTTNAIYTAWLEDNVPHGASTQPAQSFFTYLIP
jgi:hypothetical protein